MRFSPSQRFGTRGKSIALILVPLLAGVTCGCRPAADVRSRLLVTLPDGQVIHADVAATAEARGRGLMFRSFLPDDRGMLFVLGREASHAFTMTNMRFDLDIVFLDGDQRVEAIHESVPHPTGDAAAVNIVDRGSYVLELPAGTCRRHHIAIGDQVQFHLPR